MILVPECLFQGKEKILCKSNVLNLPWTLLENKPELELLGTKLKNMQNTCNTEAVFSAAFELRGADLPFFSCTGKNLFIF
jgi:hypothetical protein